MFNVVRMSERGRFVSTRSESERRENCARWTSLAATLRGGHETDVVFLTSLIRKVVHLIPVILAL